jgi:hypothetical protein
LEADIMQRTSILLTSLTLGAIGLGAFATPAAAESVPYGYYDSSAERPRDPWKKPRFEGAVGALIGGQRVGYLSGTGGGLHLDAGIRLDRIFLFGEYDFLSVGESSYDTPSPVRGFMHRFSANARYSVGSLGGGPRSDVPVRGDLWLEAGLGDQIINWHEGGRLHRRDVSFGLGAQATFRINKEKPKYLGVYYALKVTVAEAPERKDDDPMCAGPCDEATAPSPYDFGIFFNFGVPFGR